MRGFKMVPDLSSNSTVSEDQIRSQTSDGTNQSQLISFDNPDQSMIDRLRKDGLIQTAEQMEQMKNYRDHQANLPQYKKDDSIGGHFNTTMKRIVHNMTGPSNPNLMGGGGGLDLIGGRGLAKGAMNAIKYLFKSGAKTAVKKGTKI